MVFLLLGGTVPTYVITAKKLMFFFLFWFQDRREERACWKETPLPLFSVPQILLSIKPFERSYQSAHWGETL